MTAVNDCGGVSALLRDRQAVLELTDSDVAAALGYNNDRVVALMKTGAMRIPVNKVAPLAGVLQMDYFTLLQAVLVESAPELWKVIAELAPLGPLRPAEVNLLRHLRELQGRREVKPVVFDGKGVVALVAVD